MNLEKIFLFLSHSIFHLILETKSKKKSTLEEKKLSILQQTQLLTRASRVKSF